MEFAHHIARSFEKSVWPWLILFFAGLLPYVAVFLLHFPDERHYVDGALRMLETGDYWLPQTATGELRFKKPLLAYWFTAAGFSFFGISEFSARAPFLLAGCAILWTTWRIGLYVFGDRAKSALAVAILLCHAPFILASTRSIPDILLCFGITLAAFGAIRMLLREDRDRNAFLFLYGGLLTAFIAKGLLAFVFIGYVWLFALANRSASWLSDWRRHLLGAVLVAALGGAWFVWAKLHYAEAFQEFVADQVTHKIKLDPSQILRNLYFYLTSYVGLYFLPWNAAIAWGLIRGDYKNHDNDGTMPRLRLFILGWLLFSLLLFSLGERMTSRYLLPCSPLVALLLADFLSRMDTARLNACLGALLKTLAVLMSIFGLLLAVLHWQLEHGLVTGATLALFGLFSARLWRLHALPAGLSKAYSLAVGIFLAWPILFAELIPVIPDSGREAAEILRHNLAPTDKPVLFIGSRSSASRVRLCLKGEIQVVQKAHLRRDLNLQNFSAILIPAKKFNSSKLNNHRLAGSYIRGFRDMFEWRMAKSIAAGDFKAYLDKNTNYYQVWIADS
ncbi:MAG: ArnT family glycosyltransferase [Gammaproteobacteria bacterium]